MPKYQVKRGKSFGPGGRYPAGSVLELTEAEALGFEDKLERVADHALVGLVHEVLDQPIGLRNDLDADVPDELKILPQEEESLPAVTTVTAEPKEPPARKKPRTQRKKAGEG